LRSSVLWGPSGSLAFWRYAPHIPACASGLAGNQEGEVVVAALVKAAFGSCSKIVFNRLLDKNQVYFLLDPVKNRVFQG